MPLAPMLAATVEGGGYINLFAVAPPLILMMIWARLLTWVDKDAPAAHLPRIGLNVGLLSGMAAAFALFFFLPGFWLSFAALILIFGAEAGTYLAMRHKRVGLTDLKEQWRAWLKSFKKKDTGPKELPNLVTIVGRSGSPMPAPTPEDPNRAAFDAVQSALLEPLRKNAELIMLAPADGGIGVRYQVDGMEYKGQMIERNNGAAAITMIKGAVGLDVNDRRKPQRATIKLVADGKRREYRLDTAGSTAGEAARFVLDPKKRHEIRLDHLGLTGAQLQHLTKLIKEPEERKGIIIVAAPRTMGMTAALYALMRGHDAFLEHLQTIERDPESDMEGITQTKLPANASGAEELKSVGWVISQEPDAIMLNRVEDPQSANELIQFAKEKRVYVGMRAGSTTEALAQWRKLVGNDKAAVSELRVVLAGRVLRKLCMACKVSYAPDPGVARKLGLNPEKATTLFQARSQPLRDPKGNPVPCEFCSDLRYKGRIGVYEMLVVDDDVKAAVGSDSQLKAAFRKQRGKYLQEEALGLVEAGETSVQEVLRVLKIGSGGSSASVAEPASAPPPPPQRSPARSTK